MKKLAMIGCGGIGGYHLGHFLDYKDIELAGFCDIIPERAQDFAQKTGGKAYTYFVDMYNEVQPDMVFVCVPPYAHGAIEMETIRRGIPMFVEKPVALNMALANQISEAIDKKNLVTAAGFQCRYSSIMDATFDFAKTHPIVHADCVRMGGIPGTPWWGDKALSGGQIVEQTIHNLDMVRYVLGEPTEVFTMGARGFVTGVDGYNTDDVSVTVARFESGALATFSTGCYATEGACADSKITFSARDARLDHYIISKARIYGAAPKEEEGGLVVKNDGSMKNTQDAVEVKDDGSAGVVCDRTFVDAAISGDGSRIRSPYRDAMKSVAFTLACNRSIESGKLEKVTYK